jgi:hypothetical protein
MSHVAPDISERRGPSPALLVSVGYLTDFLSRVKSGVSRRDEVYRLVQGAGKGKKEKGGGSNQVTLVMQAPSGFF